MGILSDIEGMASQQNQMGTPNPAVASATMQALDEHPGALAGVINAFRNNGMAEHVQNWSTGNNPTATPEQMEQGLGGTGFIENVANKAGVSPEVAKVAMAVVLPMVMAHFTNGGQQAPPASGFGGMAGQILSRFV